MVRELPLALTVPLKVAAISVTPVAALLATTGTALVVKVASEPTALPSLFVARHRT
jgi:hypothetical protein